MKSRTDIITKMQMCYVDLLLLHSLLSHLWIYFGLVKLTEHVMLNPEPRHLAMFLRIPFEFEQSFYS